LYVTSSKKLGEIARLSVFVDYSAFKDLVRLETVDIGDGFPFKAVRSSALQCGGGDNLNHRIWGL
jgi:hypothetical protein